MSAKTSAQPGRRTPLSLTGGVTKTHPTKGGNNAANSGGNNANGHNASNSNKQDNNKQQAKTEQQQQNNSDIKENPNKKQQQQADKKQQNENNKKSNNEKNQNGVSTNKQQHQQSNENKQQQQNKDKQQQQQQQNKDKQQQNGNNDNKTTNEKDKKEKAEKSDKSEKPQEKSEKEDAKVKEDKKLEQDKVESKKEEKEKKPKEVKETTKEDKKDIANKNEEQTEKKVDKKSNEENQSKAKEQNSEEKVENMEVVEEQQQPQQAQQKSPPVTPKTNSKANKTATPVNKTPTKASEKTPQKSTPSNNNSAKTTPVTKRIVTTAVDENDDDDNDIEMEPLAIESSPIKSSQTHDVGHINIAPSATSTPGKILLSKRNTAAPKSDVQLAMQTGISPERPRAFSQISGRKSIRPTSDYTPSKFQSNFQFRESYRRINTELDVTNTSMNVTVGSEVPNNLSFSFFGRGRKRDRTPPQHSQSAIGELQTDMEVSPPKRARLDMHGFFSAVSSPLSLLRNRFSKATLQSSTPVKLQEKLNSSEDEIEVQNVSGLSVHEDIAKTDKESSEIKTTEDNDATIGEEAKENNLKADIIAASSDDAKAESKEFTDVSLKYEKTCGMEQTCEQSDIKITETPLQPAVGDPLAKNKRCVVM